MNLLLSDEFRLAYLLILVIAVFTGAARFIARRVQTDWPDRAPDVFLLVFLIQYLSVGIPGLLGLLSPLSVALTTLALSAGLYFCPASKTLTPNPGLASSPAKTKTSDRAPQSDTRALLLTSLFLAGFCAAIIVQQRSLPVISNDALTYHFPAAVHWLQTGRLSLFQTWFFNPANTYSPLAGSTLIAWWIAPLGHDLAAKYVQLWAIGLIFFALIRLLREMGLRPMIAAAIALAVVLTQPMLRQAAIAEKDDLYVAGFFIAAVAACSGSRLRDALGPWRFGIAVGLLLATKYTALLTIPLLLLLVDAPYRAKWSIKSHAIALALVLLLAGPWYLRNARLTGNPLYPLDVKIGSATLFRGMFSTVRSTQFSSLGSIWDVLALRHQSMPPAPLILAGACWLLAAIGSFRKIRSDPLARIIILGPPIGLAIFILGSPYPEARFIYPVFVLLFASAAPAIARWLKPLYAQWTGAGILLLACFLGCGMFLEYFAPFALAGLIVALVGWALALSLARIKQRRQTLAYGALAVAGLLAAGLYVATPALVGQFFSSAIVCWSTQYDSENPPVRQTELWDYINEKLPPDQPLAYTNTCFVLPLTGPRHLRPVFYVPTRHAVRHLHDLPHIPDPLSGERIVRAVRQETFADPDPAQWLKRLSESHAAHLVVFTIGPTPPPELSIIAAHPDHFELLFENVSGKIYRIR